MGSQVSSFRQLVVRISEDMGWFRAECPDLEMTGEGESSDEALRQLIACARITAEYARQLNGAQKPSSRVDLIRKIVAEGLDLDEDLFKVVA